MSIPTILVLPFPAQGHVNPMMIFSQKLAEHGFNIIFVNTDFNHERVLCSMSNQENIINGTSLIKLVSIPDGLEPEHDRNILGDLCVSMLSTMPSLLEKLIEDINMKGEYRINCIVVDGFMAWVLEVATKLGIKGAVFWPASAAISALTCNIPKLIHDGVIDSYGIPNNKSTFSISQSMPAMDSSTIWWTNLLDPIAEKKIFDYALNFVVALNLTEWWVGNTTYELEPGALSLVPKLLPIGPLLKSHDNSTRSMGQFWKEDHSCMNWLDQQPNGSVLYVAFGSFTLFDQAQFTELALGLELTNRPFLLVVRQDLNSSNKMTFPIEFHGNQGKIIEWAPQQKVLSHPAIACFVSHCGWNSTIEGLSNGVPFLCWPYFGDQIYNKKYICDELKVGLGFEPDESGVISREEIRKKVHRVIDDENIRSRSLKVKEKLLNNLAEGGGSSDNFMKFVKWLKD
ncbi:PREDICTED: UDP-glycosyltransferase 83A1-like [Lupinus angustifolius]|uniref:UDP-glycosyltransferase 83A1-like n=1 Tax=Lupinus angustifolius TaxID=3871 RepID=UPI00092E4564|nr:PREDICTED: UDP-glycosyltransferase 83A1-like [Lupinus angustifolius]XP_019426577.1 PREDICTED: UDP-glycosyltransferase 83A1-like [Lupinus angustifolius]